MKMYVTTSTSGRGGYWREEGALAATRQEMNEERPRSSESARSEAA